MTDPHSLQVRDVPLEALTDNPDQPRYGLPDVEALAGSIDEMGLLEPIVVVERAVLGGNTSYEIVAGHRRAAAARLLGWDVIPAVVRSDSEMPLRREIGALMATNTARRQMSPAEEARGYQTMLDIVEADVESVAKASGVTAQRVETLAAAAAKLKAPQLQKLHERGLSFEEMSGLLRHVDDEPTYGGLLKNAGSGKFWHLLERANAEQELERCQLAAKAKLEADGVPVIDHWVGRRVAELVDDAGQPITVEQHTACPGHAALIQRYAQRPKDIIVYLCTDEESCPFTEKWAYQREHGGSGIAGETDTQREAREARQAVEQERLAWRAQWEAASRVRQRWLGETIRGDLPAKLVDAAVRELWGEMPVWEQSLEISVALMGLNPLDAPIIPTRDVPRILTAVSLGALEYGHADSYTPSAAEDAGEYLRLLVSCGYEASDVELTAMTEEPAIDVVDEETGEEVEAYDPETHHPEDIAEGNLPTETQRSMDGDDDPPSDRCIGAECVRYSYTDDDFEEGTCDREDEPRQVKAGESACSDPELATAATS